MMRMNGGVYDPNLGRFLSVDPVFEFPTNTQSLNPYSYVLNNPLSMTDPTGYVAACGTGKANCPDSESGSVTVKTTAHDLGSHIATHGMTTITTTKEANGNTVQTASGNGFGLGETAEVSVRASGGGNGVQMQQGTGDSLRNSSATPTGQVTATQEASVTKGNANDATNVSTSKGQQQNSETVGKTTVGALAKSMSNEDRSLSGGEPGELMKGKTALANALINGARLPDPPKVAPATGTPNSQDAQIMQAAYTNRINGGADPVNGRVYYGTTHNPNVQWRPAGNGLPGAAGRETVYQKFGPYNDSISPLPTWIVIYNNPGQP